MTKQNKIIQGAGGGGGGNRQPPPPYRAPDTLHSRQFATVQDLISEGEIEGFATPSREGIIDRTSTAYNNAAKKDVFLDDTPVLRSSASNTSPEETDFNFQDVTLKTKFGTSNQTAMSGIPAESRSPTAVNVTVEQSNASGVVRQISNTDVDAVIVTLTWNSIQVAEEDGDLRGDTVQYSINVEYQGGGYPTTPLITQSVTGRTADPYSRDHRIELDRTKINAGTAFPVNIQVKRITADSTESNRVNAFQFTAIQEIIDNSSTYPNSAYMALRLDSKQFNNIPTRKYRIRGIKVRIPAANNGLTPTIDTQTGRIQYPENYVFAGQMAAATWCSCPSMILLDLLTNKRYGLGNHIAQDQSSDTATYSNLDLFSFVAASRYSNKLVDDGTGTGTQEARFSCNVNIQSPKEAFEAINDLAGVMRCMPIWSAGTVTISQDKEISPTYLFNLSNVADGGFSYSGSSLKTRNSVISVSYFNMDSREIDNEIVEDSTAISKFGVITKQIKAFACTSRNQAARLGRAVLFAEQNESETVTFSCSIDSGIIVRPGSVIEINDPVRAGARSGGRVVSATQTAITIDAENSTSLPALNDSPKISVILSNGTVEVGDISDMSGAVITINNVTKPDGTTASSFTSAPLPNSPYLVSSTTLQTQLFRVIQVEEQDDINYTVTALTYVEGKYAFIENGTSLPERKISILNDAVNPPSTLTGQEKIVVINGIARSKLLISWREPTEEVNGIDSNGDSVIINKPQGVSQYQLSYRFNSQDGNTDNFVSQVVFGTDFEILDTKKGFYDIEIFSFNAGQKLSSTALTGTLQTDGKEGRPADVTNLTIEPINEQFVRLRFAQSTDVDVLHGGRVFVRHTNRTGSGATFPSAVDVIEAVAGNSTEVICPALAGTYLLRFQDDTGQFSTNATKVSLSLVDILDSITVKEDREDTDTPAFNNTTSSLFSNVEYSSARGGLILTNLTITSPATKATGTYVFKDILDLGGTFSLTLKRHFQSAGFYPSNLWDSRIGLVDDFPDWDGDVADRVNSKLAVRTTASAPSSSSYANTDFNNIDFNEVANGTFKGRGFQFRTTLETTDPAQNIVVQELGYTAEMPTRTEQSTVIASGSGAKAVTFSHPFFVGTSSITGIPKPSVSITPQHSSSKQMATGDYFELSSISGTGFTVHFKNSGGASIDRDFTYSAVGFGKGG